MTNFSFLGCLEVVVLWLGKQQVKAAILNVKAAILNVKAAILHVKADILVYSRIRGFLSPS